MVLQSTSQLKYEREMRGWSQAKVAGEVGTDTPTVSRWERGISLPYPSFREKLCLLFNKDADALGLIRTKELEHNQPLELHLSAPETSTSEHFFDPYIPLPFPGMTTLVGRDTLLKQLIQRICQRGTFALTALGGLPGVGKTALAAAVVHEPKVQEYFEAGILWAGLGLHPSVHTLLSHWGTLLGLSSVEAARIKSIEGWAAALRTLIGQRRMLFILDDVWNVEDALALLVGGSNCTYLITTRFPTISLQVAGDGAIVVAELDEDDGIALLGRFVPQIVAQETQLARELVRSVGGLPLALTLIGKYLQILSYSRQPRRLRSAMEQLRSMEQRLQLSLPQAPVDHHSSLPSDIPLSLQTVIAVSDQQLDAQAQATLRALSVFPAKPNSFSEEAALAVSAVPVDVLDALSDTGLLETSVPGRYTMHQTIVDYACSHAKENIASERLVDYYVHYVEAHAKEYALLEPESPNILAALDLSLLVDLQTEMVRGICAFVYFLKSRGLYLIAEQYLQQADEITVRLDDKHRRADVLLHRGDIAQSQGKYGQSEAFYQEGLALAREFENQEQICSHLKGLGGVSFDQGKFSLTEKYCREGLHISRQIGQYEHICMFVMNLGQLAANQGEWSTADFYFKECLLVARQLEEPDRIIAALMHIGELTKRQGNYSLAETYLQEALTLSLQSRVSSYAHCYLLIILGELAANQDNDTQAEAYLQEGLELARQMSLSPGICSALHVQGDLFLKLHRIDAAAANFHEMLVIIPEGNQEIRAVAHYGLGRAASLQGNNAEARKHGESALTIFTSINHYMTDEVRNWLKTLHD